MEYVGLRWYKCDFHLHTMKSNCYKEKETDTAEMWVDEVKNKGLNCIAITDHNEYRGIDEIKSLCEQEGIVAFPGVELSCSSSKVHMLVIFNVDYTGERVHEFLNSVAIFSDSLGNSAHTSNSDIMEVCEKAQDMDAIVIAAHIDEFNGICEISYDNIEKIMDRKYINAVQVVNNGIWEDYTVNNNIKEVCRKLSEKYGKDISEDRAKSWYKAYLLAKKSELPILAFSDNPCNENESRHGLWGIGKDFTWLKMNSTPDLESVRQSLLSYDMRVKNIFDSASIPDNEPELWIESVEIIDTTLNDKEQINVHFNPQLNTIIGGRGSGKSSIIRTIAGGMQTFDAENLELINAEQNNFYKLNGRDKKGIFTKNSVINLYMRRTEMLYKLVICNIQNMNVQTRTLFRFDNETWSEVTDVNYLDFFKAQIYTQKQIYELALDSNSLLSIIDDDINDLNKTVDEKEAALSTVISKLLEIKDLKKSILEEDRNNTELKDIDEQISKYEASGISEALKKKQKYESQKKVIDSYLEKKNEQVNQMNTLIAILPSIEDVFLEIDDTELKSLLSNDFSIYNDRKHNIINIIDLLIADSEKLKKSIESSNWKKDMEEADNQYSYVCKGLQEQGINFDKLDDLLEKKKAKILDLDKIKINKDKLILAETEWKQLYDQYEKIATRISTMRTEFINNVIGKDTNVKFQINRGRNRSSFIQMMKTVLNKDNATIDEDVNKCADVFFENKGMDKFRSVMWNIRERKDKKSYSGRMRTAILEMTPEAFARMISFIPEDDLKVSYKPEKSKKYIPLSNASAGQKTTAILTFLLAYGEQPLLLDQPEDDLDNKLVYDLIVTRLKKTKSKRQIIVVTHNANIPVNGDAEYIVSMDSDTDKINTKFEGTMDDEVIRKEICDVMEGTQDAFEMRAKKYHFNIVE